jgi:NTE family protein
MQRENRPFVLSGGGARGFAHLGVLKAFEEKNIYPQAIAATSSGSIVAACLANGYSTDEVKEIFLKNKIAVSMQWAGWRSGFLSLKKVEQLLKRVLRHLNFEDLEFPLFITATDFITGEQVVFERGPLLPAILAASSIPILFRPVEIDGVPYVDGGLSGNLPAEPLLQSYQSIVGVHVNPLAPYNVKNGFLSNVERILHLAIRENVLKNRHRCALFIEPAELAVYGVFDFKKFDAIYTAGLTYTREYLRQYAGL